MRQDTQTTADGSPPTSSRDVEISVGASVSFLGEWNAEILQFYLKRYQQYWALPVQLQSCESVDDLRVLQQDFQHTLFEDYYDEAMRLSRVVQATCKQLKLNLEPDYETGLVKAQQDAAAIIQQAKDQAERILASAHRQAVPPAEATKAEQARKRA